MRGGAERLRARTGKEVGSPSNPLRSRIEPLKSLYENIPRRIFKEARDARGVLKIGPPPICFGGVASSQG